MKNKLELKHVKLYRPYRLKFIMTRDFTDDFDFWEWDGEESDFKKGAIWEFAGEIDPDLCLPMGEGEISWVFRKGSQYISIIDRALKPILRPLSDYLDINSEAMNILNIDIIDQIAINDLAQKRIGYWHISYKVIEIMAAHHIDFFDLIPKGLAVDINTLALNHE